MENLTRQHAELANLHQQGLLSDDEFRAAKAELLGPDIAVGDPAEFSQEPAPGLDPATMSAVRDAALATRPGWDTIDAIGKRAGRTKSQTIAALNQLRDEGELKWRRRNRDGVVHLRIQRGTNHTAVGGWGWAVVLLTWIGGLIGYFSLREKHPERANHVMKWGLIWTVMWGLAYAIFAILIVG